MKKLIFILLLISITANAQSWKSTITTNITVSDGDYIENHADKAGIHIITHEESSNDIKYYLINTSGTTIRSATISTNGEYPNIVGDANAVYVVYREGSNIRIKKSTNAGVSWSNKTNQSIGSNPCSGIDAEINADGIHVVWSIGDADGYNMETKYKRFVDGSNGWYDYYTITNYSGGYGTSPTVSLSPNRVHVGYNSSAIPWSYYAFDENEMSRTKYNTVWQTQQTVAYNESGRGKIFAASSKLYDFYYDYVTGPGHDLYFKYRNFGSSSWSSRTLLGIDGDATRPLVICETENGNIHSFLKDLDFVDKIIINGSINNTTIISSNSVLSHYNSSVHNDIYVNWKEDGSNYLKLRQYDSAPAKPGTLNSTSYNNHPKLYWPKSNEPDIASYRVYKNGSYLATTSNTYYVDNSETIYFPGPGYSKEYVSYKIKAVDNGGNFSTYSNTKNVAVDGGIEKAVAENIATDAIKSYALNSNYPNPFNPTTNISYQIPQDGFVNYNALGQEVAELVNQNQSMGKYTVKFSATNLPSGVYIYKLQAGEFSSVKKMLLTK